MPVRKRKRKGKSPGRKYLDELAKKKKEGISQEYYGWMEKNWKGGRATTKSRGHAPRPRPKKKIEPGLTGQVKRGKVTPPRKRKRRVARKR